MQTEQRIEFEDRQEAMAILGCHDEYLKMIQEVFKGSLVSRDLEIVLRGEVEQVDALKLIFKELKYLHREGTIITAHHVQYSLRLLQEGKTEKLHDLFADTLLVTPKGRQIKPKTLGQLVYLQAIRSHDITFGIGPAGTGKTYLAVAMAVTALKNRQVEKIILTRPAVEAGEKLGFLPGDMQEKVDPYLRPLYDALDDTLGKETFEKYMTRGIIEVAPLAYMRGRTLDDAFIILDEAQNTTPPQMKMFLTRMGFGSKMVVTGDLSQIDLPHSNLSGLRQAYRILQSIPGIKFHLFDASDVVRHEIVGRIIRAYENFEESQELEN